MTGAATSINTQGNNVVDLSPVPTGTRFSNTQKEMAY